MNPPPPMFPASGQVTASAKAVATAASTAFPPRIITSRPTRDASIDTDTTAPCRTSIVCPSLAFDSTGLFDSVRGGPDDWQPPLNTSAANKNQPASRPLIKQIISPT